MSATAAVRLPHADWIAEAGRRFGKDGMKWQFVCPSCKHVASVADYKEAGAPQGAVAFSCVGRWLSKASDAFSGKPGPCNYAGGGFIGINPIIVFLPDGKEHSVFEFAEASADR